MTVSTFLGLLLLALGCNGLGLGHATAAASGCSASPLTIYASTEADLSKRLAHSPTVTVIIHLKKDIVLTRPLNMSSAWSCTSIRSPYPKTFGLVYHTARSPAVYLWEVSNVFFYAVNFYLATFGNASPCYKHNRQAALPGMRAEAICPCVYIWRSHGIKLYSGSSRGRIDVIESTNVHLDAMTLTAPARTRATPLGITFPGTLRFVACGDRVNLIKSNNLVTNCNINSGGNYGVLLHYGTVGVTLRNNFIHNFYVFGIYCGSGGQNVADCMLCSFDHNFIYAEAKRHYFDGAGIYFATHWVSPGNTLTCNYIQGGQSCYYLDYASSGITINGGVCIGNVGGVKLNTGKSNVIKGVLMYRTKYSVLYFSCQNAEVNNCHRYPADHWARFIYQNATSAAWHQVAPFLPHLCNETHVDGYLCNTPPYGADAKQTDNCGGLPTRNDIRNIMVDASKHNAPVIEPNCNPYTNTLKYNQVDYFPVRSRGARFINKKLKDFGVRNHKSSLYKVPGFVNCPRSQVGPQGRLDVNHVLRLL